MLALVLSGCDFQKFLGDPLPELAPSSHDAEAAAIWRMFWRTFQDPKRYPPDSLLVDLKARYQANPHSRPLTKALAYFYLWRVVELHAREDSRVQDDWLAVRFYFERLELQGETTARNRGWLGLAKRQLGQIHQRADLRASGIQSLTSGVRLEREFTYFSAIYGLASLPMTTAGFQNAISMAWKKIDSCLGESIDRSNPDYAPYMKKAIDEGPEMVCWDSPLARHNFSGTFLFFGDLFLKAGETNVARRMYLNARLAPTYSRWPYRAVLEERLKSIDIWATRFADTLPHNDLKIMPETDFSCRGCHLHVPERGN